MKYISNMSNMSNTPGLEFQVLAASDSPGWTPSRVQAWQNLQLGGRGLTQAGEV